MTTSFRLRNLFNVAKIVLSHHVREGEIIEHPAARVEHSDSLVTPHNVRKEYSDDVGPRRNAR